MYPKFIGFIHILSCANHPQYRITLYNTARFSVIPGMDLVTYLVKKKKKTLGINLIKSVLKYL